MISKYSNIYLIYIVSSLPLFIVVGPFFSDLVVCSSSFLFLITIKKTDYKFYFLNKYSKFFFVWYLYLVSLSLFSENIYLSLESTLFYFRFWIYSLSLCYILINFKNSKNIFFYFFAFAFLLTILDAYFQLLFGYNFLGYEYSYKTNQTRLSGLFGEEKVLGSYLSRLFPLLIGVYLFSDFNKYFKIYYFPIIITLVFILILFSGERSAFVLFCFFLFFLFLNFRYFLIININKIFIFFSIIIVSCILIFSNNIKNRFFDYTFHQFFIGDQINIIPIQHQVVYETSLKIFMENKFIGIAPKLFREKCSEFPTFSKLDSSINGCQSHPHNTVIQILVETGIVGLMFFLIINIFFISHLFNFKRNYDSFKSNQINALKLFLISIFISLFPFLPTGNFFNNWLNCIYYMPVGYFLYYKLNNNISSASNNV